MAELQQVWFDLKRLGFPGWEHTQAFRATTNSQGRGWQPHYLYVRMQGSEFATLLFDDGRGTFKVVKDFIEGVEVLTAKQDRRAS